MRYIVKAYEFDRVELNLSDRVKSILQNIAVLLSTRQGDVPLYRKFGLLQRFLDKPINIGIPIMVAEVTEAMQDFIHDAELIRVIPELDPDVPGKLRPVVEVEIADE